MRRVVVVQWSRLGDLLQTRPLLSHIARRLPEARITLCADSRYADIVAAMPERVEFWPMDLGHLSALAKHSHSQRDLLQTLRVSVTREMANEVDEVYVLSRSLAACLFAELLKPTVIHGYRRNGSEILIPAAIRQLDESKESGTPLPVQLADLWTCLDGAERHPQWLSPLECEREQCAGDSHKRFGLLCDAGEQHRTIPAAWLADLAARLSDSDDCEITLYGSTLPASGGDALSECADDHDRVRDMRGRQSLRQFFAGLASQNAVLGPDTGGLHLAAALNVPVVGVYIGGASCLSTGPYAQHAAVIENPPWNEQSAAQVASCLRMLSEDSDEQSPVGDPSIFVPNLNTFGLLYDGRAWTPAVREAFAASRRGFVAQYGPELGVSIIIPECGQTHYTDELLEDLKGELTGRPAEVILVASGASKDRDPMVFPDELKVVRSETPLTFAQACNLGAAKASFSRLLFLNNDTRIAKGQLGLLLVGAPLECIASPVIRYPDGLIQNRGVRLQDGRVIEIGHGSVVIDEGEACPDAVSAVALLVGKESFDSLHGFDEQYVNGFEDLDFCLRAREAGIACAVVESSSVTHYRGSTPGRFSHEEPNWSRFSQRWKDVLQRRATQALPSFSHRATRLLILSAEPACAAGSCLRWTWPLKDIGLDPQHDFVWMTEDEAQCHPGTFEALLSTVEGISAFRALEDETIQRKLLSAATARRLPVLVDSDDLLIGRFSGNSRRSDARQDYENRFRELLRHASIIIASTEPLRDALADSGYAAEHLPTLPHGNLQSNTPCREHTDGLIRIGFFGTPSHLVDLGNIVPALALILNDYPQARFFWWGCRPGELAFHPQVRQGGPVIEDYATHLHRLHSFGLDFAVVPLLESRAATMKTAVKYFEYASAGITGVYSAVSPYSACVDNGRTGLLCGETTDEWVSAMRLLIEDQVLRSHVAVEARAEMSVLAADLDSRNGFRHLMDRMMSRASGAIHRSLSATAFQRDYVS